MEEWEVELPPLEDDCVDVADEDGDPVVDELPSRDDKEVEDELPEVEIFDVEEEPLVEE